MYYDFVHLTVADPRKTFVPVTMEVVAVCPQAHLPKEIKG